jgi:hypothetical protein
MIYERDSISELLCMVKSKGVCGLLQFMYCYASTCHSGIDVGKFDLHRLLYLILISFKRNIAEHREGTMESESESESESE